ncbi:hypothetical protein M231_03959 [Tremella mesenterica]|uniref:RED-like N-terminal domain-containing protein n=1 Tax=Tremella mesenterica TaxID=5217 RepID=A0A4Q1BLV2_TREME|nr:hypothetical protein M231_03959 [Tremella mesenterica]
MQSVPALSTSRESAEANVPYVEKLLQEFESRKAAAPEEADQIEETRKYLGGDAQHSILVKGLDYALLAARKAELAREKEGQADEDLDQLAREIKVQKKVKVEEVKKKEEKLGKGFKSIAQKEDVPKEKKKKKKKKVVIHNATIPTVSGISSSTTEPHALAKENIPAPSNVPAEQETEYAEQIKAGEDDEDIFADAGSYDLHAAVGSSESDGSDVEQSGRSPPGSGGRIRLNTRSKSRSRSSERRTRGRGRHMEGERTRSYGGERHDEYRDDRETGEYRGYREEEDERGYKRDDRRDPEDMNLSSSRRRRDPKDDVDQYRRWDRKDYDDYDQEEGHRNRNYRHNSRSPSPDYKRPRYSSSPHSHHMSHKYDDHSNNSPLTRMSPNPSRHSPPRDKSPPRKRARTRSITPNIFQPSLSSRSPSPSSDVDLPGGRLQPLSSTSILDVRSFLQADATEAILDEKKLRKAEWRAKQGLGVQEGVNLEKLRERAKGKEKDRMNKDYMDVMNRLNKKNGVGEGNDVGDGTDEHQRGEGEGGGKGRNKMEDDWAVGKRR